MRAVGAAMPMRPASVQPLQTMSAPGVRWIGRWRSRTARIAAIMSRAQSEQVPSLQLQPVRSSVTEILRFQVEELEDGAGDVREFLRIHLGELGVQALEAEVPGRRAVRELLAAALALFRAGRDGMAGHRFTPLGRLRDALRRNAGLDLSPCPR